MPGFSEGLNQVNGSEGDKNQSAIQSKMDEYYRKFLGSHTMLELVNNGLNFSEFVDSNFTKCALDEQFSTNLCKKLEILETFQGNSMCYTMFHASDTSQITKLAPRSGIATSAVVVGSTVINIEESERPMQPNELIRFLVNFQLHEATSLNEPPSGRVVIHDSKDIPAARMSSTYMEAGKYYEIYISEQVSELLPAPYESNCTNYWKQNIGAYENVSKEKFPHPMIQKPLSQSSCYMGCLGKRTKASCGCWPPEIPYLAVASFKGKATAKLCNWLKSSKNKKAKGKNETAQEADNSNAIKKFNECLVKNEQYCSQQCPKDCTQKRYFTTVQSYEWPSDERINFSSNAASLRKLRECCAIVSIRYYTDEATMYISSAKYEIIEFFSYIGGIVSLWLGFTFIGIYDYLKDSNEWFKKKMRKGNGFNNAVVKSTVRMSRMAENSRSNRLLAVPYRGTPINPPTERIQHYGNGVRSARRTVEERYPWIYSKPNYIKPNEMIEWKDYYQRPKERAEQFDNNQIPIQRRFVGNPPYISSYRFQ